MWKLQENGDALSPPLAAPGKERVAERPLVVKI